MYIDESLLISEFYGYYSNRYMRSDIMKEFKSNMN